MRQLPLEVQPERYAVFETWQDSGDGAVRHALTRLAEQPGYGLVWLWGTPGAGKSHLLQACVARASARSYAAAYLPLSDLPPEALEGMERLDLVCLDDMDAVIGRADWERALFRLWESLRQRRARLAVAARQSPLATRFGLADLASRMASGATFRLEPLGDDARLAALQLRARWMGTTLPGETARWLLARVSRDPAALFALLERLDREALVAKKALTVPFVRGVLARGEGPEGR